MQNYRILTLPKVIYPLLMKSLTAIYLKVLHRLMKTGSCYLCLRNAGKYLPTGGRVVFTLKKNVKFHDDSEFNADKVIFSLERYKARRLKDKKNLNYLEKAKKIYAENLYTVVFESHKPLYDLPYMLAMPQTVIVSPASAPIIRSEPVGTGPYMFAVRQGNSLTLKKNPDYHRRPPHPDRIEYIVMPPAQADDRFNGNLTVSYGASEGRALLVMNNARKPFNRIQDPADTHPFDPDKAKFFLRSAGYAKGFDAELLIPAAGISIRSADIIKISLLRRVYA
ncbi:hypothetical protein CHS0354_002084 [Potamilus streckersoni]|uniref:Solute-binding protein family 5 domain-containing protein n=1 Tax=Potamilus streckersoni TaxID=2493646 RepID=A0AAE0W7F9_9BIVA|nr:hypothetical protein CHS0354_002084 [Potamilus streckersoni]